MAPIMVYFGELPDPRVDRTRLHRLDDIVVITILAVICGADSWTDVADFGRAKESWLRTFLALPNGIPSHDTIGRVFAALDPTALERCFVKWTADLATQTAGQVIAIDGKTLRHSFDTAHAKAAIHMVSAWAAANQLVLAQVATDAKSNEITAIPKLLELLDLKGSLITIDAMGCQKEIARKIVDRGGDYLLAVKDNQPTLHERVKGLMDEAIQDDFAGSQHDYWEQTEKGHGRIEIRRVWCTGEAHWIQLSEQWPGLASLGAVECERILGDKHSRDRRYFISSLDGRSAQRIGQAVRDHWGVENGLHWSLDVSFGEDACRVRANYAAENFSRLKRIGLNLLKQEKTLKVGIKGKRLMAGWDEPYLLKVLRI